MSLFAVPAAVNVLIKLAKSREILRRWLPYPSPASLSSPPQAHLVALSSRPNAVTLGKFTNIMKFRVRKIQQGGMVREYGREESITRGCGDMVGEGAYGWGDMVRGCAFTRRYGREIWYGEGNMVREGRYGSRRISFARIWSRGVWLARRYGSQREIWLRKRAIWYTRIWLARYG